MALEESIMRVDVHAHYLPVAYLEALRRGDGPAMAKPQDDASLQAMIAAQDAAGIDIQILSTGPNSPYLRDGQLAADAARIANDSFKDVVDRYHGRFAAFGSLPLPHAEAAKAEAVRCLDELNFAGLHLGCSALGESLDDPKFDELWSELDSRDAVLYLHPGGVVVGTEPGLAGMDNSIIAVTIGSGAEIATAALRLAGLCQKYRRIRPIIGLLGGALPFLLDRVTMLVGKWPFPSTLSQFASADHLVSELRRFHYDINLLPDPHVLASARRAYGIDRLVFGSDLPSGSAVGALQFLRDGGFGEDECQAILGRNAQSLFEGRLASAAIPN